MAADDASDAEALFCLELYVHRVERLPRRLREAPPALALRFLDYAPVVVEPPSGARGNHRGSCWYGGGKRCVFEAREGELAKKLEGHYRDAQDIEFTVEDGRLWLLQTRNAKRTARAAVQIAVVHGLGSCHRVARPS